jgi:hypothetical protein
MNRTVLFIMVLAAIVTGCRKDTEKDLPPLTQSGENRIACLINGKERIYTGESQVSFSLSFLGDYVSLVGKRAFLLPDRDIEICFESDSIMPNVVYQGFEAQNCTTTYEHGDELYKANPYDGYNWLMFTRLDTAVAAGIFQFRCIGPDGDMVNVTSGRFDIAR